MQYAYECFLSLKDEKLDTSNITPISSTDNLFVHTSKGIKHTSFAACFDMDWTLTRPVRGLFPKDDKDITLLPRRLEVLKKLYNSQWTIVIFTNQLSKGTEARSNVLGRLQKVIRLLEDGGLKIVMFASLAEDEYRKPNIGMWEKFVEIAGDTSGFYVGDSAGRPQDKYSRDKDFAESVSKRTSFYRFFTPEEFFPPTQITLPKENSLVVMVGMQGTGKSSYANSLKDDKEYTLVESDAYRSNKKALLKAVELAMLFGEDVVVDATNPTLEGRQAYYDLAKEHRYTPTTVYMVRNGEAYNKLRDKPVPRVAMAVYLKNLVEPVKGNTPGRVYQLDRA